MEIEENMKIRYIENITNNNIKFKLSLINNKIINIKVSLNNTEYINRLESYNFNSFEFFEDLSAKEIYNHLKDNLSVKNIKIEQEEQDLKVTILIKTEFEYENFSFYVLKNNNKINKENNSKNNDTTNLNQDNNEIIIDKGDNSEKYLDTNKKKNKEIIIQNNFNDLNNNIPDNNYKEEPMEEYTYFNNQRTKQLNDLYSEKEKVEIIKQKYLDKKIFCFLCQNYQFINKFYKSTDEVDYKILVKFYCSETHRYHSCSLIELLFQCCQFEINEENIESYRDGKRMALTNEELISIKNKYKIIKEKASKKNKLIKDKIIKSLPELKDLTVFQKKLYQKFERAFNNNSFYNDLLLYFIQMCINTYEQSFHMYHSQAIICTLRNFTDYSDEMDENDIQNYEIKNDITKDLLNAINYFKKKFIIKIYEPEIDLNKFKNKINITISKDDIMCFRYINKYKILLLGSIDGKIYCFNIEQNKCFLTIQAHKEEEEKMGNWGILYINEIGANRFITCCEDSTMKLWEIVDKSNEKRKSKIDIQYITVIRGHKDMVRKVIQLKRGKNNKNKNIKLVTCSFDCCLGFWEEKTKNKFELLKIIQSHNYWINEIYEIYDGRIFAIGGEQDPYLKIWDQTDYSFELIKEPMFSVNHDTIIEINKDYYIIGGNHTYLFLFRLSGKMIIRAIYIDDMYINSLFLLSDGNLLADSGKDKIKYVDLGTYEIKDAIETNSDFHINWYMMPLDNRNFVTTDRKVIKIWEY